MPIVVDASENRFKKAYFFIFSLGSKYGFPMTMSNLQRSMFNVQLHCPLFIEYGSTEVGNFHNRCIFKFKQPLTPWCPNDTIINNSTHPKVKNFTLFFMNFSDCMQNWDFVHFFYSCKTDMFPAKVTCLQFWTFIETLRPRYGNIPILIQTFFKYCEQNRTKHSDISPVKKQTPIFSL